MDSNLANNKNNLMISRGASASEVGQKCGVDKTNISRILSSKTPNPKIETLKLISDFFEISVDELITENPFGALIAVLLNKREGVDVYEA